MTIENDVLRAGVLVVGIGLLVTAAWIISSLRATKRGIRIGREQGVVERSELLNKLKDLEVLAKALQKQLDTADSSADEQKVVVDRDTADAAHAAGMDRVQAFSDGMAAQPGSGPVRTEEVSAPTPVTREAYMSDPPFTAPSEEPEHPVADEPLPESLEPEVAVELPEEMLDAPPSVDDVQTERVADPAKPGLPLLREDLKLPKRPADGYGTSSGW